MEKLTISKISKFFKITKISKNCQFLELFVDSIFRTTRKFDDSHIRHFVSLSADYLFFILMALAFLHLNIR